MKNNRFLTLLGWFFSIFFLLGALGSIQHPLPALFYGLLGFILLPPGHRWIEKTLKFQLTTKVKSFIGVALFAAATPLAYHYAEIDKQEEKSKAEIGRKEQQKRDSLTFYIQASTQLEKEHQTDEASNQLHRALAFASTQGEKDLIAKDSINIAITKAIDLVKFGKYLPALDKLNLLIGENTTNSDLLYNRAICYSKTGKIQEAVTDCKAAIQLGNKDAERLHDKINPIQKRIAYYIAKCCDGTTSTATGRGACSHHGGVCQWNVPVYEESRKYE